MQTPSDKELGRRIGQALRETREARGLTLAAVAESLGITYQQLRKYEAGDNRISASMLYRLSGILKLDLGRFFADVGRSNSVEPPAEPTSTEASAEIRGELLRIGDPLVRQRLDDLLVSAAILNVPKDD